MIVGIAQETLSVVVRQRPETQLAFFALLARSDGARAKLHSCDHIKGVSPKARSGAIRALQVAGLVQICAKGRGWSEYVINTEPMQDQNVTSTEPLQPEAAPVVEFADNEDETNAEPTRNEDMTSAGHEGGGSEDIAALTALLDKCANETQQRLASAEPARNEDITSAEPLQPEPAPILDFCNNKHATNAEPMQDEHEVNSIFLDLDDDPEPLLPAHAVDDEAKVEARAREIAAATWDGVDARTFEACRGDFDEFWLYRKKHFRELAAQELASETM
jgi:hypothetical protein